MTWGNNKSMSRVTQKSSERGKRWYQERKDAGLCTKCNNPAISTAYCEACLRKARKREQAKRDGTFVRALRKPNCQDDQCRCQDCGRWLPDTPRGWGGGPQGSRTKCARCTHLWTAYRITSKQYNEMLIAQGGLCKVCHLPEEARPSRYGIFEVDHKHDNTREVRGLLHGECNRFIGFMESPLYAMALEYLERAC